MANKATLVILIVVALVAGIMLIGRHTEYRYCQPGDTPVEIESAQIAMSGDAPVVVLVLGDGSTIYATALLGVEVTRNLEGLTGYEGSSQVEVAPPPEYSRGQFRFRFETASGYSGVTDPVSICYSGLFGG